MNYKECCRIIYYRKKYITPVGIMYNSKKTITHCFRCGYNLNNIKYFSLGLCQILMIIMTKQTGAKQ
jgi:hypothetical protein